jgi:hypothetical protein
VDDSRADEDGTGPDELRSVTDERDRASWIGRLRTPRGALAPVAAMAVLALVLLGLSSGRPQPSAPPVAGPTSGLGGDGRPDLVVEGLCTALTDSQRVLVLTFRLVNLGSEDVVIDRVEPSFPIGGGFVPVDVGYTTGDCLRSEASGPGVRLEASEGVRVTFQLRLPRGCAAPYPVAATIHATTRLGPTDKTVTVLPDLGSIPLPGCPST